MLGLGVVYVSSYMPTHNREGRGGCAGIDSLCLRNTAPEFAGGAANLTVGYQSESVTCARHNRGRRGECCSRSPAPDDVA